MRRRPHLAVALLPLLLAGCFTGKRPSLSDDVFASGNTTGDPAVDAVLAKLDDVSASPSSLTAGYDVLTKFGEATHHATVTLDSASRAVTMDQVRYIQTGGGSQTCIASVCSPDLNPTAISDTQLTIDFYGASAARRLRVDAAAKIGPSTARTDTIAGQSATCVDVAQANNTAVYCALDSGPLAELDDADVRITLTSFSPTVDPQAFDPPA